MRRRLEQVSGTGVIFLVTSLLFLIALVYSMVGGSAPPATPGQEPGLPLTFDGNASYEQILAQVAFGPRPAGSEAGWATGDYIMTRLQEGGFATETQEFDFQGVKIRNVIGRKGTGPVIILGAHYDTRPAADQEKDLARRGEWIEGANDGGSGVAVLLELARVLEPEKLKNEVWLAFFDAEDRGHLEGWPFSVGAGYMAENLTARPRGVVVVDMVGDADQQIYYDGNSDPALRAEIWNVAADLGYRDYLIPEPKYWMIDDHMPFREAGIPAIDIIDFDYPYWHTVADTADKVAPISLERVGRTLEVWLEEKQSDPGPPITQIPQIYLPYLLALTCARILSRWPSAAQTGWPRRSETSNKRGGP